MMGEPTGMHLGESSQDPWNAHWWALTVLYRFRIDIADLADVPSCQIEASDISLTAANRKTIGHESHPSRTDTSPANWPGPATPRLTGDPVVKWRNHVGGAWRDRRTVVKVRGS